MVEQISREEAAWLAGIIEGEGSFFFQRHGLSHGKKTFRAAVTVTNTDARLIRAVSKIWWKLNCKFYYQLKKTKSGYALSVCSLGKGSTTKIIDLIFPFLQSKMEQAELLKEFNREMGEYHYQRRPVSDYADLQIRYVDKLISLRVKTVNPQRLQRTASQVLELG